MQAMPRIFDNLAPDSSLLPALQETLGLSSRAGFYVGCPGNRNLTFAGLAGQDIIGERRDA